MEQFMCSEHRDPFESKGFKFTSLIDMTKMHFWRAETERELKLEEEKRSRRKQERNME